MRFIWVLLIWHIVEATNNDIRNDDFPDPTNPADNAILWKDVFSKLNTMLSETEKISKRNEITISKRNTNNFRQDDQEKRMTELLHKVNGIHCDNQISQWTTVLRRQDGSVNFTRKWDEYKNGFGNPNADHFIGLEMLHDLTTNGQPQELQIILIDFEGETRYAKYDLFRIGSEDEKYAIKELGKYNGDAGDGMAWHRGKNFSTIDRDNNLGKKTNKNCPENYKGGWWFHDPCYSGHLHGPYREENSAKTWGVSWHPWRGWDYSLKYAAMMIRPKL